MLKNGNNRESLKKKKFKKIAAGLSFLFIFVMSGYISHCAFHSPKDTPIHSSPMFEIYPKEDISPHRQIPKPRPVLPRVAIIIDDMGYDRLIADKFLSLNVPITFSIFPHSPFQERIARKVRKQGSETMLHLPMEPVEYPMVNPGPGALLTSMAPEQIMAQLNENLNAVPFIKGVNNHMGSKMTTVPNQMYQILSTLKKRKLFFIDSFTTSDSLCRSSARLLQIPFAQRDVFLDHVQDKNFVHNQIQKLIRVAHHYGEAIGIGHPHRVTYEAIRDMLPELKKRIQLVPASKVVHTIG